MGLYLDFSWGVCPAEGAEGELRGSPRGDRGEEWELVPSHHPPAPTWNTALTAMLCPGKGERGPPNCSCQKAPQSKVPVMLHFSYRTQDPSQPPPSDPEVNPPPPPSHWEFHHAPHPFLVRWVTVVSGGVSSQRVPGELVDADGLLAPDLTATEGAGGAVRELRSEGEKLGGSPWPPPGENLRAPFPLG